MTFFSLGIWLKKWKHWQRVYVSQFNPRQRILSRLRQLQLQRWKQLTNIESSIRNHIRSTFGSFPILNNILHIYLLLQYNLTNISIIHLPSSCASKWHRNGFCISYNILWEIFHLLLRFEKRKNSKLWLIGCNKKVNICRNFSSSVRKFLNVKHVTDAIKNMMQSESIGEKSVQPKLNILSIISSLQ